MAPIIATRRIPASHPSLPGHFPGQPVVPGVVILDTVVAVARASGLGPVAALPRAKFLAPLLPEVDFRVEIDPPGTSGLRAFRVIRDGTEPPELLCSGQLKLHDAGQPA
ncbi:MULTISPECIES: hypothetical protein [unclassified Thioalkalivibrio]|uniref:hypothetical protein n=1 Tax=unclassified Thioalkalivibrio TaxID=2621013 RepID=UPI00035D22E6|nr:MULTISPECIES: hypothetical protein [unclassified Thioalkalivibrio]